MSAEQNIESDMRRPIPGGFLVAVEGIDGSGKTTVARLLAQFCAENRLSHVVSKEPTTGVYGQQIRDSAIRGRLTVEQELAQMGDEMQVHS